MYIPEVTKMLRMIKWSFMTELIFFQQLGHFKLNKLDEIRAKSWIFNHKVICTALAYYSFWTTSSFLLWAQQYHTVPIWTFTFHKISGFVRVILKANFKPTYRPNLSNFLSENPHLLNSFFFYFLRNLSNPLLFTHCCC